MNKSINKTYEFGKHKGVAVFWNEQTDTVELPEAVFRYILSLVPTEQDRPQGHWIKKGNTLKCPFCGAKGEDIKDDYCFNYCPNCGAEMTDNET